MGIGQFSSPAARNAENDRRNDGLIDWEFETSTCESDYACVDFVQFNVLFHHFIHKPVKQVQRQDKFICLVMLVVIHI